MSRRLIFIASCIALVGLSLSGCAGGDDKPEMMPIERVVDYSESVNHDPVIVASAGAYRSPAMVATCRRYRERMQTYHTATAVSAGISTVGLIVGLLSDSDTVKEAAGVAAVAGTIGQATSSSAARNVAEKAREAGCVVR